MNINEKGLEILKHFEGCRLEAYPDPGTGGEPYTIGYGHTGNVKLGMKITQEQADELLKQDLHKFEVGVMSLITHVPTENQFSALVCFAYNVGLHALENSHLLKYVNGGDLRSAAKEFLRWNKSSGKELPGLTLRRKAESDLFSS